MKTLKHCLTIGAVLIMALPVGVQANFTANYGNHEAATVWYDNIEEDTQIGKYGAPTVSTAADFMAFTPLGMHAAADNGIANSTNINNAHLLFDINAKSGNQITDLSFFEQGDFTMIGGSSDLTSADITAKFQISVYEYADGNGDLITPFFPIPQFYDMVFSPNSDGTFEFITDGGGTNHFQGTWTGDLDIDLAGVHLPSVGIFGAQGATKMTVSLDNIMTTDSEVGSSSEIYKKFTGGFTVTAETIPEPASVVLMVGTASLVTFIRRRFI